MEITNASDWWLGDIEGRWFKALETAIKDEWGVEPLRIREGGVRYSLTFTSSDIAFKLCWWNFFCGLVYTIGPIPWESVPLSGIAPSSGSKYCTYPRPRDFFRILTIEYDITYTYNRIVRILTMSASRWKTCTEGNQLSVGSSRRYLRSRIEADSNVDASWSIAFFCEFKFWDMSDFEIKIEFCLDVSILSLSFAWFSFPSFLPSLFVWIIINVVLIL